MIKKYVKVGGELENIVGDGIIAAASKIKDYNKDKTQEEINTETYTLINDVNERLSGLSPDQQSAISVAAKATNNEAKLGYYVCDTDSNVSAKVIPNATGYVLSNGGSIKVKMTNANSASNATLNINSTGTTPLYYGGERASVNNTWEEGETLEVYYDGTNYYANNVAGGSSASVFDVSIKYPTSGVEGGNTYTLEGALAVLNANLSANKKKGGMSIKFVQNSDNKYVQFRYMLQYKNTTAGNNAFKNTSNWQGVDEGLVYQSNNIITGGAVGDAVLNIKDAIGKEETFIYDSKQYANMFLIVSEGYPRTSDSSYNGIVIPISAGEKYIVNTEEYSMATFSSYPIIGSSSNVVRTNLSKNVLFTAGETEKYLLVSLNLSLGQTVSITRKETGITKRLNTVDTNIKTLFNRSYPITNSNTPYSRYIIDAYIANYDNNYLYYIDMFFWKHSEFGTRIRIQKENKSDHTTSVLVYDTNVAVNNDDVQILNIKSGNNIIAKLVVNTKYLDNGTVLSGVRIEFSNNVSVNNGLYLGYKDNYNLANSAYSTALQSAGLAQSAIDSNAKTNDSALLRKSINLFDGHFSNYMCNSTTGIPEPTTLYRMTKNAIPVSVGQTLRFTRAITNGRTYCGGYYQEYSDVEGNTPILRETRLGDSYYTCTDSNVKSIRTSFRIDQIPIDPSTMEYMVYVENTYSNMYKKKASDTYPVYVPYGYLNEFDAAKNTLLCSLTGKNIVCLGDSITQYGFYPQLAGLICGANVKNCGVGGTWLTHRVGDGYDLNTAYGKFSGDALADSIASGDFSAQTDAADYIYQQAGINVRYVSTTLSSMDWSKVDIITFAFGTNDYNNTIHIEGSEDSIEPITYRGAINYIVQKISSAYPHIRIFFLCPMYRVFPYGHENMGSMTNEEYHNSTYQTTGFEDSDTWENAAGYTLKDVVKMIEEQAAINHCGCLNMYYNFGNNKYTYLHWLVDGTHLTYDGYREFGSRLAKFLMSD